MPLAAFILGLLSLIVALLALGWNVGAWLMATGRAKCILLVGFNTGDAILFTPVGRNGQRGGDDDVTRITDPRFGPVGQRLLGIEVRNVGRASLVVSGYEAVMEPRSMSIAQRINTLGPALPQSIAPGDSAQWWVEMDQVVAAGHLATATMVNKVTGVHMKITTGLRREVRTKTSLPFSHALPSQVSSSADETTDPEPPAPS